MNVKVTMPQMGESIAEGTITRWLKQPGDRITRDEPILEITTDKVDTEVPAPAPGVLIRILAAEGQTLPVGAPVAEIETEEQTSQLKPPSSEAAAEKEKGGAHFSAAAHELVSFSRKTPGGTAPAVARQPTQERSRERVYSPSVMRAALAAGLTLVDLDGISGSGFHGRVTEADVQQYKPRRSATGAGPATAPSTEAPAWLKPVIEEQDRVVEVSTARKRIAEHMTWSRRVAAHATAFADLDMSGVMALRQPDVSYLTFFCMALVKLLQEYPAFNACVLDESRVLYKTRIRLGIAVAVEDELFVPVVRDADELNFSGMARAIRQLTEKTRSRQLTPDDLRGGTFTVTNPGMFGGVSGTPIINQPQVAILGLGAIVKKPVVVNDAITIRPMMTLSLSFDHRLIDGAAGFRFLEELRSKLEKPALL